MDPLVESAIAHWGPRFTTNGVTVSDFHEVTARIRTWDDWCREWSATASQHEALGRLALDRGYNLSAGEHLARAAVYYHFAKFVFVVDPDQMRAAHQRAVACHTAALPWLTPPGRRIEIPFEQSRLVGVLRLPATQPGARGFPVVLLIPGLDSTKEELRSTEDTFLARGLATLSVDGPGQGEAEYDLPIRGDWAPVAEAIWAALDGLDDIDRDRLGVWGVSLGGYYSPRVAAALGPRVSACVALAGPFNFGACWEGLPQLTRDTFRHRSGAETEARAREIALTLDLAGVTADIVAPLLVVFGRQDRLIPPANAERLVAAVGDRARLLMLEAGNHGCANVAPQHRPATADWMADRLLDRGEATPLP